MGNVTSYLYGTEQKKEWTLPRTIKVKKLLEDDKESVEYFGWCLSNHGYALFENDTYSSEMLHKLYSDRDQYFQQPQTEKDKNKDPDNHNLGYVNVKKIREYIKLRTSDSDNLWPNHPANWKEDWTIVYDQLQGLAWKCFLDLAKYAPPTTKLNDPAVLSAIEEFVKSKSSISLIHYFPADKSDLDKCTVCAEHEDTGLLTFGVRSDVPGLVIFDQLKKDWVEVEQHVKPTDIIAMVGQKIPLFSGSDFYKPTLHKVTVEPNTERNAMVFLLDVAK